MPLPPSVARCCSPGPRTSGSTERAVASPARDLAQRHDRVGERRRRGCRHRRPRRRARSRRRFHRSHNALRQAAADFSVPPVRVPDHRAPRSRSVMPSGPVPAGPRCPRATGCTPTSRTRSTYASATNAPSRLRPATRARVRQRAEQLRADTHAPPPSTEPTSTTELLEDLAHRLGASEPDPVPHSAWAQRPWRRALTVGAALLFALGPRARNSPRGPRAGARRYRGRDRGTGRRQQVIADHRIEGPLSRLRSTVHRNWSSRSLPHAACTGPPPGASPTSPRSPATPGWRGWSTRSRTVPTA